MTLERKLTASAWYKPMAASVETAGNKADSQVMVEIRQSTLSECPMPIRERQRNTITER